MWLPRERQIIDVDVRRRDRGVPEEAAVLDRDVGDAEVVTKLVADCARRAIVSRARQECLLGRLVM